MTFVSLALAKNVTSFKLPLSILQETIVSL
jgi:hypothetical protein